MEVTLGMDVADSCLAAGSEFDFNARRDATTP
jgi:hypothetical protein